MPRAAGGALSNPDRKSTRLNSSHGYISYAVFCLKKNITGDVHRQIGRIEKRDSFYPRFSSQNSLAKGCLTHSIGADDAQSCDDNARNHIHLSCRAWVRPSRQRGIISIMPLGLYISVPFCRTKCSYCNFASDVFSRAVFHRYVERVCSDMERVNSIADHMGGQFDRTLDSIYLGGGTPTILDITELERLFVTISQNFRLLPNAEVTVECAPGTLTPAVVEGLQRFGVNRVSLGVQSFVDQEAAAVGRLHSRNIVLGDIARLRAAGISNINIDLIAGLPHQTRESWEVSVGA